MSQIIEYFRRRKPAILKNPYFLDDVNISERYFDGEFDYVGWMEAPEKPIRCRAEVRRTSRHRSVPMCASSAEKW